MTAAFTGVAGFAAITRAESRQQILLAAVPLIFSIQQSLEGLLWLTLPNQPDGPATSLLVSAFLLFAKVVWPVLIPLAVTLAEPVPSRRRVMAVLSISGSLTGAFFLWSLLVHAHGAVIASGHISYSSEPFLPLIVNVMYVTATCCTPLQSSYASLKLLGAIVTVGSLVTYVFYWEAFTSVWCFFAAAASCVIVYHFEKVRQTRQELEVGVSPS